MIVLKCEHCRGVKLKETNGKAGTIFTCPKCHCRYRLMIAVNDNECWRKRFPTPKKEVVKKVEKKKTHKNRSIDET
jgi:hypothetical protein